MFRDHWMGISRTAVAAAVAIVVAAPALAQNTTAGVAGLVTGADGKPLAGASVTIVHVESRSTNTLITDADGRYAARGLRTGGPYTITISKDGLVDKREGVYLALAETAALDVQLGASTQTVVVTGRAVNDRFNRSNIGASTNVGTRELAALASINRNLQDYARTDPRLAQTDKDRGEISALGQNSRYNSITIDGVNISDTFGLEANTLPTVKQPVSIDAIQSVQVNVSNYDVTQKGYTGANINAVTKSGTNEFHGSAYFVFRNTDLVGQRLVDNRRGSTGETAPPAPFKETTKGFTLGGPIIKDKLFFFANYEELASSRAAPDWGPIGSGKSNVGITQSAIDGIANIARNVYSFEAGGSDVPSGTQLTVKDQLLKLDWTINDQHRASLRYAKTEESLPNFPDFGSRALSLSSHWYSQDKSIKSVVAQWFADWTPTLSTEVKISKRDYASEPINRSTLPAIAFDFSGATPPGVSSLERTLWLGTERSRHFNQLKTETTDAYFGATWALGEHEMKFGGDLSRNQIFDAFLQDANGQFKFQCESGLSYSFGAVNCATATAATIEAAVLENFRLGRVSAYQAQLPLPGKVLADGVANWNLNSRGLFVQDTWTVNRQLTLSGGVRLDTTTIPDKPIYNAAAAQPVVAGVASTMSPGTGTRQTGGFGLDNTVTPDGKSLFQPRLGFNWNLGTPESRMQLRGGAGLFEGAAATVWLTNPFQNTGAAVAFFGCGSSGELVAGARTNPACGSGVFTPNPGSLQALGGNPAPNIDYLSNQLTQPAVWKFNLAFDTELPWGGFVAGAELVHTTVKQAIYYQHLNLGAPTRTGSDGRDLYYNAAGYNSNCWTTAGAAAGTATGCGGTAPSTRALNNSSYGNVTIASSTNKGGGDTLTLSLSQTPSPELRWSVSYSYATAKEVSPLTSSVALSNWRGRSNFNPNEEVSANSAYLTKDRIAGQLTWSKAFVGSYKTTAGVFYEGRRGKPYSWTYYNDLNGDGSAGNDLMYIPSAPGSSEVAFAGGAAEEARFWEVVNGNKELSGARGGVVKRNGSFAPWVNNFDLRFSQEIPGFLTGHKGVVTLDFLNFGNFLSKKWGRIEEVNFQSDGGAARSFVNYKGLDANGKYIYSLGTTEALSTRQAKGESQWAMQVTLKYQF